MSPASGLGRIPSLCASKRVDELSSKIVRRIEEGLCGSLILLVVDLNLVSLFARRGHGARLRFGSCVAKSKKNRGSWIVLFGTVAV